MRSWLGTPRAWTDMSCSGGGGAGAPARRARASAVNSLSATIPPHSERDDRPTSEDGDDESTYTPRPGHQRGHCSHSSKTEADGRATQDLKQDLGTGLHLTTVEAFVGPCVGDGFVHQLLLESISTRLFGLDSSVCVTPQRPDHFASWYRIHDGVRDLLLQRRWSKPRPFAFDGDQLVHACAGLLLALYARLGRLWKKFVCHRPGTLSQPPATLGTSLVDFFVGREDRSPDAKGVVDDNDWN